MEEEIVYADKSLRRRIFIFAIILIVIGVCVVKLTQEYFHDYKTLLENDPKGAFAKLINFLYIFGAFLAACILTLSSYILWLGMRIVKKEQFPPPGMKVIRDTKIVKGRRAKLRGILAIVLAVTVLISALFLIVFCIRLMFYLVK